MASTFFFYDLETSGLDARRGRIMQFAGQRTDMDLQPIGEPYNIMVKLTDDILPDPVAISITGITPQMTLQDGISEPEFCRLLVEEIFTPQTITVGYNSARFDDEFIRHTLWRNFQDPYEWAWSEGRSRWDMLDVVRITRALRPDGIEWPVDATGKAINKLELISRINNLEHTKAHDALSDVVALIGVARLIRQQQPRLFEYMLSMRGKRDVEKLVNLQSPQAFIYSSGRYDSAHQYTTIAYPIAPGSKPGSVVVYDLRYPPATYRDMTVEEIQRGLFTSRKDLEAINAVRPPVKELTYNRCPAVAPMGVLDTAAQQRLMVDLDEIRRHMAQLQQAQGFIDKIAEVYRLRPAFAPAADVEGRLYDSFTPAADKVRLSAVRAADATGLADFQPQFVDPRLPELLFRYKARHFPTSLSEAEQQQWETYRSQAVMAKLPDYLKELTRLAAQGTDQYLLEELQLWGESVAPGE